MKFPLFQRFFLIPLLTVFFAVEVDLVFGQCQSDQQSLLLQLKNSLVFDQSTSIRLVQWNSSTDCCGWEGVTCDEGGLGCVIGLDLSNEAIFGGLDNSNGLFGLQFLQSLNFSLNNFNTVLPDKFGNLTDLISLDLSDAGFVGQIPIEISKLTKLVSLDLSTSYSLKLEKPNFATLIQNLTRLTELRLDGVNISAQGEDWCQALSSSLPNLKVLSMSYCGLSRPIDASLAKLQSLSVIRLSGNQLSAPVSEFFANYSKLTDLQLSNCELKGKFPQNIFQILTLEILDLSYNQFLQGSFPEFHQHLPLQTLVLSYTNFSGTLPQSIGDLRKLSRVELLACNFTGPIPSFRESKDLTYLDFSGNQLTGEIASTHWEGLLNLVYVDLSFNSLSGSIPSSLFAIASLENIQLSHNQFGGRVPEFPHASSSPLQTLDLSGNNLEGPIPSSVFGLANLSALALPSNKLNGMMQLDWIQKLPNLSDLDLSYNNITVNANASNSIRSSPLQINLLRLASCNLRIFPDLSNQPQLIHLDLSENQITGLVPGWISVAGILQHLNLSHNLLVGLEQPLSNSLLSLRTLDLHHNQLQGSVPITPSSVQYVDYSSNNLSSSIPPSIGNYLYIALFFSLSNNNLRGEIPQSVCNANSLKVLDLSSNNLNGTLPACLIERTETLSVLNLRRNKLDGNIPRKFPGTCQLQTLDLSENQLDGEIPDSLESCNMLEVLDLANNQLTNTFPCLLTNISSLRVLVLRSNGFYGHIGCAQKNVSWPRLQIVDLASNKFSGDLPQIFFSSREAMMGDGKGISDHIQFPLIDGGYYQDSVTVTNKGLKMELVRILTAFTIIDMSSNNFEGEIPEAIGQLTALYGLNLSHNALTGQIPSSLGNLSQLESLDLSANRLTGKIPQQLGRLTFLSYLNLSNNSLVGEIPTGPQLQTFSPDSFKDNEGLCGLPLNDSCSHKSPKTVISHSNSGIEIDWNIISFEVGYVFGLGIIILPLVFCKRWRTWYYKHVNRVLFRIFPQLDQRSGNHSRRAQRNRRRH